MCRTRSASLAIQKKTYMTTMKKNLSMIVAGAVVALFGFQGCDDDTVTEPVVDNAEVMFFHGAADAGSVDIVVDDAVAVSGVSLGQFTPDYLDVAEGMRRVRITLPGDLTGALIDQTIDFDGTKHYTAFAITDSMGTPSILRFEDNLDAPAAGKAHIRVAHLVPDGPAIKLSIVGAGSGPVLENVMFGDKTEFFQVIDAGAEKIRVQAQSSGGGGGGGGGGGSTGIIPDIDFTFADGGIYTVVVIGKAANSTLQGVVIEHKHN